jgi:hypothetical protein
MPEAFASGVTLAHEVSQRSTGTVAQSYHCRDEVPSKRL